MNMLSNPAGAMWKLPDEEKVRVHARFRGCLLGGAVVDALGAPVEFMTVSEIREAFGRQGIRDFIPAQGQASLRGKIERNTIALLSNQNKPTLDAPSSNWLGHHSARGKVRLSGLWNNNHVDEDYDPLFLRDMEELVVR